MLLPLLVGARQVIEAEPGCSVLMLYYFDTDAVCLGLVNSATDVPSFTSGSRLSATSLNLNSEA